MPTIVCPLIIKLSGCESSQRFRISLSIRALNVEIENRTTFTTSFIIFCFFVLIAYPRGEIHPSSRAQICTEIDGKDRTRFLRTINIQGKAGFFVIHCVIPYMVGQFFIFFPTISVVYKLIFVVVTLLISTFSSASFRSRAIIKTIRRFFRR